jgi:putative membrane protein
MLWIKAFHIISMVAWFAGLFYLPRLFVYHTESQDIISIQRFMIMERRLYYGIIWPAAIITSGLGMWLISYNFNYYMRAGWMHFKLTLVVILWAYHLGCGHFLKAFAQNSKRKSSRFFRVYNEIPTILLIGIIVLVVVKP